MNNFKIRYFKNLILLNVLILALASCSSKKGFQASDVAYAYNTKDLAPRPEFVVQHLSEDRSRVYYRISSTDLLYMREPDQNTYQANFNIHFSLVPSFEITNPLDSGIIKIKDEAESPPQKALTGYFDINTSTKTEDRNYVLKLEMIDENRQVQFDNFIRLDKSSDYVSGNFLMTDTAGNVIYKNHIPKNTPFLLDYSARPVVDYWVSFYNRDFPLALPPYSSAADETFDLKPDSTFRVRADQPIELSKNGFYHFRIDTSSWEGFTVYSFYDQFPFVAQRKQLGPPLRYLTTKREYEEITSAMGDPAELKKVVDEFWLDRTGSVERSKILLAAYYNRVQEANVFFSSYIEGWKTDRGIIYVIYGPPNRVFRSTAGEAWVYGDETSSLSYYFNFVKVSNPFTDNDYSLDRMNNYRYGWGQAIEAWRNGHIYNSKDIKREQDEQEQSLYRQGPPYWY